MRKPKVKKPYKSLSEIYLNESFSKPVPILPRSRVLIYRENADVVVQQDPPHGQMHEFEISNQLANKLINTLTRQKTVKTPEGEASVDSLIQQALEIDRWNEANPRWKQVLTSIQSYFDEAKLNTDKFYELIDLQKDPDNLVRTVLIGKSLGSNGAVAAYNFNDLIPDKFKQLFVNPEDAIAVMDKIYNYDFKAKVSVGKGEIALTLISDAIKGEKGDLFFDGIGEVEYKASKARLGGNVHAVTSSANELSKIYADSPDSQQLSVKVLDRARDMAFKGIESWKKKRSKDPQVVSFLDQVKKAIDDDENLPQILSTIDRVLGPYETKWAAELKKSIQTQVKEYTRKKAGDVKGTFKPAFESFFNSWQSLTDKQLAQGLLACRNYPLDKGREASIKSELEAYLLNKVKDKSIFSTSEARLRLLAAIHLVCYHYVEGFKYIIFGNNETKNLVTFTFPGKSVGENVESAYNFFNQVNAKIDNSIDNQGQSVQVTVNP